MDNTYALVLIGNVVIIGVFAYFSRGYLIDFVRLGRSENLFSTNQYSCVVLTTTVMFFLIIKLFVTIQFLRQHDITNILFENIVLFALLVILSTILPGRTIRRGLVALKKEIEYKKTFVRYISHEIRSPLSTTTLGLDYLIEQVGLGTLTPEELLDVLKDAKTSCEIATNTLNDLLMFDKIEANMLEIEPTVMFIYEFVSDCVRPFKIQANSMNITINITTGSAEKIRNGYCKIDKHKMQQVIRNFLTNAIKFTPEQGSITIDLSLQSDFRDNLSGHPRGGMGVVRVAVQDTGPGISQENIPKLFGQYVQIDAKKLQGGKGSGLGLWLSKSIVEMHGGYMGVSSDGEGMGCNFYFEIPCYTAEEVLDPSTGSATVSEQERDIRERQSSCIMPFGGEEEADEEVMTPDRDTFNRDGEIKLTDSADMTVDEAAAMWTGGVRASGGNASASLTFKIPQTEQISSRKYAVTPTTSSTQQTGQFFEDPETAVESRKLSLNMLSTKSQHAALATLGLFQTAKIAPTTTHPHPQHKVTLSSNGMSSNQSSVAIMSNRSSLGQGSQSFAATSDSPSPSQPFARGAFERAISNLSTMSGYTNGSKKTSGKIRLLIADDAVISRKMVERALASVCSTCHHANNGLEALNKTKQSMLEEAPYDVVLIDYYMPIMTGAEAVLGMRTAGFKGIIMAVTGST
eukprot:gene30978-38281_t